MSASCEGGSSSNKAPSCSGRGTRCVRVPCLVCRTSSANVGEQQLIFSEVDKPDKSCYNSLACSASQRAGPHHMIRYRSLTQETRCNGRPRLLTEAPQSTRPGTPVSGGVQDTTGAEMKGGGRPERRLLTVPRSYHSLSDEHHKNVNQRCLCSWSQR